MFRSLRARLLVTFIPLAVIPVIGVSLMLGYITTSELQQQAIDNRHEVALRVSAQLDAFITLKQGEMRSLAEVSGLSVAAVNQQSGLMINLLTLDRDFQNLILIDQTGQERIFVSRGQVLAPERLTSRAGSPEFSDIKNGQVEYVKPIPELPLVGQPGMTLAIPIFDPQTNQLAFVLVADVRFQRVWELLAQLTLKPSEEVYILDGSNHIIAYKNPWLVLTHQMVSITTDDGEMTGLNSKRVLFARENLAYGTNDFVIVSEQAIEEALAGRDAIVRVSIGAVTVVFLIALLITYGIVLQIVRPIKALALTAASISAGDLALRANTRGHDEISALAQAFNNMSDNLHALIDNLEVRIHERTRDLELAAEVSKEAAAMVDIQKLLPRAAELTRNAFGLYQVSIYVFHHDDESLWLEAGMGALGESLGANGQHFSLHDPAAMIAKAAQTRQPVVINDSATAPDRAAHPLLAETRAAAALPMVVSNRLIGVLDLQSRQVARFAPEDLRILQTLADRIGVSIRNAQLFRETEAARFQAEQASRIKSSFLANMSHELRTPLNSIINFTKFVSRGVMGPVNAKQIDTLSNVVKSGEHLLALINDVLDISKIEAGGLKLFIEDNISLTAIVESGRKTAQSLLGERAIRLNVEVEPDLPLIAGDRQRILQVMLNLVSNACKFTKAGEITIRARRHQESWLQCSVSDTGPGIAAEDFQTVFAIFGQTPTGSRQGNSTGLGLPISRSLVEAHGGRLWIESTVGVGSTFYFTLPTEQPTVTHTPLAQLETVTTPSREDMLG